MTRADETLARRTTLLCGLVVILEGYDLSALGYVVPQLVEAWRLPPVAFTPALTASNVGMFLGAVVCGWLGDAPAVSVDAGRAVVAARTFVSSAIADKPE